MDATNNNAFDEVAAAEAELRAAQEKLAAAKARAAASAPQSPFQPQAEPPFQPQAESPFQTQAQQAYTPPSYQSAPQAGAARPAAQQPGSGEGQAFGGDADYRSTPQQPYGQASYQQPYGQTGYQQPYGQASYQQSYPRTASKDHVAAGLLAIFLGYLGIHKFYLGYNKQGFILLAVTVLGSIFTLGLAAAVTCIITFIEGIIYLVKTQAEFERIYVFGQKEWF